MGRIRNIINKWRGIEPETELKPLKVEPVSFAQRLGVAKKKKFIARFAIIYNGKAIREFQATDEAFSRDQAAKRLDDGMSIKLLSVVQEKPRKDNKPKHYDQKK